MVTWKGAAAWWDTLCRGHSISRAVHSTVYYVAVSALTGRAPEGKGSALARGQLGRDVLRSRSGSAQLLLLKNNAVSMGAKGSCGLAQPPFHPCVRSFVCVTGVQHEGKNDGCPRQCAGHCPQRGGYSGRLRGFGRRLGQVGGGSDREVDHLKPGGALVGRTSPAVRGVLPSIIFPATHRLWGRDFITSEQRLSALYPCLIQINISTLEKGPYFLEKIPHPPHILFQIKSR